MEVNRPYENKATDDVTFFVGTEVENSPARGYKTLFVVGSPPVGKIFSTIADLNSTLFHPHKLEHVYLGANKSFDKDFDYSLVGALLVSGYMVTLDYPFSMHEVVHEELGDMALHQNFIPMISLEFPRINSSNYNTTIKLDDSGFNHSNPGVWCHSLHDLKTSESFTPWRAYKKDTAL